jgi:biopolymer transport protein TolR
MAMGGGSSKGLKNEINITPLVDVVLVLLIIFMVVTPMLQRGKDVRLPPSQSADKESKEGDPIILSLTENKTIWVENEQVDDSGLAAALGKVLSRTPGRKILLKGDERLTYGDVRRVMDLAKRSGAHGVSLGVEEKKAK